MSIVIDAVRRYKLALNHGLGGQIAGPSSYLMKTPKHQVPDDEARLATLKFIEKHKGKAQSKPKARKAAAKPKAPVKAASAPAAASKPTPAEPAKK